MSSVRTDQSNVPVSKLLQKIAAKEREAKHDTHVGSSPIGELQ